ncbi:arylesterase [Sphingomonas glacialis]|uniref:Arylesterase n=1 Tax=Sphingomonas glacialis TaxID=658225 RepID=A0A502G1V0_9SPHN|nr:arylesterase [Sphingomonas glacialis]TPG55236.1 arylesterase [Sphingomonas glacialis]
MVSSNFLGRYRWRRQIAAGLALLSCVIPIGATASPKAPLIWAFGDSLTAGYGLPPEAGFTAKLQAALRRAGIAATVRNGGVAGDTVAQARARLRWGLRGLGATPDLVIVELGANDMLRGLPVAQAKANLDAILTELQARHIPVLLAGMRAAPNLGREYVQAFDAVYPTLAKAHSVPRYPFFLDGVAANPRLIQADGMHPNARGVDIIVARIVPSVRSALRPEARR